MEASENILSVLKEFEGYLPIAKQLKGDRIGIITGGYGTIIHPNGEPVKIGDVFSKEYALHCLVFEVNNKCERLNEIIKKYELSFNQNQFDALACFIYNLGIGKLEPESTMGMAIASKDINKIADAFLVYNKGTKYILGIPYKAVLGGLVKRRNAERALFLS